jgi:hypothetical protein
LPRRRSPSRGKPRRGSRSDASCGRHSNLPSSCRPTTIGCSVRYGGGERPATLSRLTPREKRGTFTPGEPTHTCTQSLPHPSSVQPTVDSRRRLARGVTRSGDLRCSTSWQACTAQEAAPKVRYGSLPAFLRKREGCRTPRASKEAHGKRGPTHRHGLFEKGPSGRGARGSDARGRARASLNVAEVDRQWPAQRSGRSPFHPIWIAFRDGRLARSSTCEST